MLRKGEAPLTEQKNRLKLAVWPLEHGASATKTRRIASEAGALTTAVPFEVGRWHQCFGEQNALARCAQSSLPRALEKPFCREPAGSSLVSCCSVFVMAPSAVGRQSLCI